MKLTSWHFVWILVALAAATVVYRYALPNWQAERRYQQAFDKGREILSWKSPLSEAQEAELESIIADRSNETPEKYGLTDEALAKVANHSVVACYDEVIALAFSSRDNALGAGLTLGRIADHGLVDDILLAYADSEESNRDLQVALALQNTVDARSQALLESLTKSKDEDVAEQARVALSASTVIPHD